MRKVLAEIREGTFAQEWIKEMDTGETHLDELREKAAEERVEDVGREAARADAPRGGQWRQLTFP